MPASRSSGIDASGTCHIHLPASECHNASESARSWGGGSPARRRVSAASMSAHLSWRPTRNTPGQTLRESGIIPPGKIERRPAGRSAAVSHWTDASYDTPYIPTSGRAPASVCAQATARAPSDPSSRPSIHIGTNSPSDSNRPRRSWTTTT